MGRRQPSYQAILQEVSRGSDRSPLFHFMVERHDEIMRQAAGKRLRWSALCQLFAQQGLTDVRGGEVTPDTARKTWLRARHAVAAARRIMEASASPRRPGDVHPSCISKIWRPQIVSPDPRATSSSLVSASESKVVAVNGRSGPTPLDAPYEFDTVDDQGNQLPEGMVFYRGNIRPRHGAEQSEKMLRRMKIADRDI